MYRVELPYIDELTLVYLENSKSNDSMGQLYSNSNIVTSVYAEVEQVEIDFTRPIVILGPIKDQINNSLIKEFPEKFEACVPRKLEYYVKVEKIFVSYLITPDNFN
ncbi:disks large homolog 1-like [Copidosoma floridanum]|uniref:disks large homolog 1-like n=1 Tax=Copidosoma floridanum TaxID=29053 RepID=UPI0006C996C3|nr:disks large homolog 1-like [Copidosoma floridanum]